MKAIKVEAAGEADVLEQTTLEDPQAGAQEVIIKVRASGLNGADLMQRRGHYPPPPGSSPLLGLEVSGTLEFVGREAEREGWAIGDPVIALLTGGGYAEKVSVRHDQLMKLPPEVDLTEAGGIAEAFITAYLELVWLGHLKKGQRLLIHAGASGVGTAAIQIARSIGAEIWVTASSEQKLSFCKSLGADHVINYKSQDFAAVILDQTGGLGVDCILDLVGGSHFPGNLKTLGVEGKLLLVGMGGGIKSDIDLRTVISKRLQIIGSTLRARSLDEKGRLIREFWEDARPKFAKGEFRPVIDKVFAAEDVRSSHLYMESQGNIGKILLRWT